MARRITVLPTLLAATVILGLALATGLWLSGQAHASSHGATRSISPTSVAPGAEITVTINATNLDTAGQVVETLPAGFAFVAGSTSPSSVRANASGQDVTFIILGANQSFSYKVTASSRAGDHTFGGTVTDTSATRRPITGDSAVTVRAAGTPAQAEATRALSDTSVGPGDEITVTITPTSYGSFGQVVETLPAGFAYVPGSVTPSSVRATVNGQDVTFILLGDDTTFRYKVTASDSAGSHTFTGRLVDDMGNSHTISGASRLNGCRPDAGSHQVLLPIHGKNQQQRHGEHQGHGTTADSAAW